MQEEKHDEKEASGQGEKKKISRKVIIIAAVAALVLLLVGGGATTYFLMSGSKHKASGGSHQAEAEKPKAESSEKGEGKGEGKGGGTMKPLDPFVVNLTDVQGGRYLKVVMQLELDSEQLMGEVDSKTPQIRDEIITLLSSKSFDDLSTVPGKRSLKRGIVECANKFLTTGKIVNVYFSEFVIQ